MNPNDNQSVFQPTPAPVDNGQSGFNPNVASTPKRAGSKKPLIIGILGVAVLAAAGVGIFFLFKNKSVPAIDFEEENKISINSVRAAEVNPMNYELSEHDNDEAEEKAGEFLDSPDMDIDALLKYFKDKIQGELDKNNTDEPLKLLWKERDVLQKRGFNEQILQVLLDMDTSKLVTFQKIFLYRAIVTASAILGNEETMNEYTARVYALDPSLIEEDANDDSPSTEEDSTGDNG